MSDVRQYLLFRLKGICNDDVSITGTVGTMDYLFNNSEARGQNPQLLRGQHDHLPRMWIKSHYANFNGVRAIAVALVFFAHAGPLVHEERFTSGLWVGVDLFFVLSGFLITGILYDSTRDPRYFQNFYRRRALRIFPIFYGFFLLLFAATPFLHLSWIPQLLYFPLYLGNYPTPFYPGLDPNPGVIKILLHGHAYHFSISHLWSLCVEEQFYLVWPVIVYLVQSRKTLMKLCLQACVLTLLLRVWLTIYDSFHHFPYATMYEWSITRSDTLLWGGFLALWLRGRPLSLIRLRRLSSILMIVPTALILVGGWATRSPQPYGNTTLFMRTIGYTLVALTCLGFILYSLDEDTFLARILRSRWLTWFGTISYGFYFFHLICIPALHDAIGYGVVSGRWNWALIPADFIATLVLATISFRYFESPILRLKSKWAPQWSPHSNAGDTARSASLHVPEPQPVA